MTEIFDEGDEVRITRDLPPHEGQRALPKGSTFTVESYVSAEESDDGVPFYWLNSRGGTNTAWALADAVERVRTAEQMAARALPTKEALAADLGGVIGNFRDHEVDESDRDGKHAIEFYGTTAEGLPFGFRVRIEEVWATDE